MITVQVQIRDESPGKDHRIELEEMFIAAGGKEHKISETESVLTGLTDKALRAFKEAQK